MSSKDTRGGPGGLDASQSAFVQTFFKRGAEITEELIRENERLREQVGQFEQENAALRTQLASDDTLRVALRKIEDLEREKKELVSHIQTETATATRFEAHHAHMEAEIANLANLYVALYQLHASLDLTRVTDRLRELLAQLIGAREYAIYVTSEARGELVPVAVEGDRRRAPTVRLRGANDPPPGAAAIVERVFLTGDAHIQEGPLAQGTRAPDAPPVACVPLRVDGRAIGVIVVYDVLPHKERFLPVDYELFKLLGAHAATALVGALLHAHGGGVVPGVEAFRSLGDGERGPHGR
jgi:hypothetical protein